MVARGCLDVIVVQIFAVARKTDFDRFVARRVDKVPLPEAELAALAVAENVEVAGFGDERAVVGPATGGSSNE